MDWSITPQLAPGLDVSEAIDGLVIYQHDRDRLHYLNQTAAFILQCCDGKVCAEELAALMAEAFGLSATPIDEVGECLTALMKEGILVVDASGGSAGKLVSAG
jgi:hypothetical protein